MFPGGLQGSSEFYLIVLLGSSEIDNFFRRKKNIEKNYYPFSFEVVQDVSIIDR